MKINNIGILNDMIKFAFVKFFISASHLIPNNDSKEGVENKFKLFPCFQIVKERIFKLFKYFY